MESEIEKIIKRYNSRKSSERVIKINENYLFNFYSQTERELIYLKILKKIFNNISVLKFIEIGAGTGTNLYFFLKQGISPGNIYANELLFDRLKILKRNFPAISIIPGDAVKIKIKNKFDIVFQSTVFTSILDMEFKRRLAQRMWKLKTDNGIILWYDFLFNNPFNKDVKGIKKKEILSLFPNAKTCKFHKVTLAPPLGRKIGRLYNIVNGIFPFLRTHIIAVIK